MPSRVYIETSVVSYLTARPSRDVIIAGHQAATHDVWQLLSEDYEAYVSDLVIQEAKRGDTMQSRLRLTAIQRLPVLEIDDEVESLARVLLDNGVVPPQYVDDALHIAVTAINELDLLLTWNFKHMNNPTAKKAIGQVVRRTGYAMPEICSPDELLGDQ